MSISGNWERGRFTRRQAIGLGGAAAAALTLGRSGQAGLAQSPYGDLVPDPGGLLDLPPGFHYRVLSEAGKPMSDGKPTPGDPDGMAAFNGPGNTTVLIRNHELGFFDTQRVGVEGENPYTSGHPEERGGTTGVIVSPDRRVVRDFVTSAGTRNNCAGGPTPWGTWLTCEEDRDAGHGFVFEVRWDDPEGPLTRQPIVEMGFFSHEAVAIDPTTGYVYLTEDDFRNLDTVPGSATSLSYLYRYRPNRTGFPGALQQGGVLESPAIEERTTASDRTADFFAPGQRFALVWKQVSAADPPGSAEAQGCVRFNRLEGAYFAGGAFWFDDTNGGESRRGQVFRYIPATNTLELFLEATSTNVADAPDNVVVTPWGDLWFCEDGAPENRIQGVRPDGTVYTFATGTSELAGPTFAPNGNTFFVNAQDHQLTFAIWGPFARQNRAASRMMAAAAPPARYAPRISGELADAAERHGLTELEAAAFDRLGVSLT